MANKSYFTIIVFKQLMYFRYFSAVCFTYDTHSLTYLLTYICTLCDTHLALFSPCTIGGRRLR